MPGLRHAAGTRDDGRRGSRGAPRAVTAPAGHPGGVKVRVVLGELATWDADVVVRVVGPRRRDQTDDDAGLLAAAGPPARAAFEELLQLEHPGGLPPGRAVSTTAGLLPARWLVHVAAPVWSPQAAEHLLAAGHRAVLDVAGRLGATTVAMTPPGMTRPYWPVEVAVRVATTTLPNTLTRVRETVLVVRTAAAVDVLAEALARRG